MIKVVIHRDEPLIDGNDNSKNFRCLFASWRQLDKFISEYQYAGGILQFNYDVWEDNVKKMNYPHVPIVNVNKPESIKLVFDWIYKR